MAGIARTGDFVGKGGVLTGPFSSDVFVNNRPVALTPCLITPHPPCGAPGMEMHCFSAIGSLPEGVYVNGDIPVTRAAISTCKDVILTSSSDVTIAGGFASTTLSIAAAAGGGGTFSGYERLAYTAAGQVVSGEDIGDVAKQAAIGAVNIEVGQGITKSLQDTGLSKELIAAGSQIGTSVAVATVTGGNVDAALTSSVVSAGVGAGVNATAGAIKKL